MSSRGSDADVQRTEPVQPSDTGWTPRIVVSLIAMCMLLDILAITYLLIAIALPTISAHYQTTQGAWLVTAFLLVGAVSSPLIGKLADTHGKRRFLIVCIALASIGALIAATASTLWILIFGCALMGTLNPCVFLVYTLIPDVFPKRTTSMSMSVAVSGMGLAAIPAPFLAGWLLDRFGFHSIFWFLFICLVMCAPALRFSTGESRPRLRSRLDLIGAVLLGAGIAGILVAISITPQLGWAAPKTIAYFFGGVVLLMAWIASARLIKQPLIDLRLLATRAVALIAVTAGLAFAVSAVFVVVLPYMAMTPAELGLGYGFGVDANGYALIQAPYGVTSLIGGAIVGWLVKRTGARITMVIGMVFMVSATLLTAFSHTSEAFVIAFTCIMGLGTGFAYASAPNLILAFIPESIRATVGAITTVVQTVLPATLPIIAFAMLNSHVAMKVDGRVLYSNTGISLGFVVGAVGAVLGIVAALALPRTTGESDIKKGSTDVDGAHVSVPTPG